MAPPLSLMTLRVSFGPANVYAFPSPPVTLFDCGPQGAATESALMVGLAGAGLDPRQIARVVISHGHADHYGMAPRLQELSGAAVLIGELDLSKLVDDSMFQATGKLMLKAGIPMDRLVEMGHRERKLGDIRPRVEGAEPLRGGERLVFDDFELDVLHLPGHTAGHICLLERGSGVLFAGDTLLLDISPNPMLEPDPRNPEERRQSLVEYLHSLDRLSELPLTTVFPGHGPPIEDPHGLIEEMRTHHHQRTERLAGLLDEEGLSGWQLANRLFPKIEGFDNFLAVSEVVAHIDLLVLEGRAEPVIRDGITYYRKTRSHPSPAGPAGSAAR
jgi:glyoxylase-like metal-dependent hydrolase (beta-lactamase superfamily II)